MSFDLVTSRFYHKGKFQIEKNGKKPYDGGQVTEFLDVDIDRLSYFEMRDYVKELGYEPGQCLLYVRLPKSTALLDIKSDYDTNLIAECLSNGDILEAFVCHLIADPILVPPVLGYGESGVIGGEGVSPKNGPNASFDAETELTHEAHENVSNLNPTPAASNTTSPVHFSSNTPNHPSIDPTVEPDLHSTDPTVKPNHPSTIPSVEPEPSHELVYPSSHPFDEQESDIESLNGALDDGSDVDEELRTFREEKKKRKRRKRGERAQLPDHVKLGTGKKGPDAGYDESTGVNRNSVEGRLAGDEPYYPSDECPSLETDPDDYSNSEGEVEQRVKARRRKKLKSVVFDATSQKIVWELGLVFESVNEFRSAVTKYAVAENVAIEMYINEPRRVRVRCTDGCPWLLFASFDSRTNNFVVKTYNPVHKCDPINRTKLCNSKFLASYYNERIKEQPNIRIFEFQGIIKKELDLYVGRTVCRRARNKVLQELMGDYNLEFGRILDYRDELLRTNPGSTCVVKLHEETFEDGRKMFQGFYICFNAMKKSYLAGCRKCIGLDGCFLKGVTKGQLLIAVCKDGNNQMLPLAWAVVEVENQYTWSWFVNLVKEDLQLGDGTDMTVITDMQKGLENAISTHLPNVEHRMCARHILVNWSRIWKGIERRKCFWRCARSSFEAELKDHIRYMKRLGNKIVDDLLYYNPERWSRVYFNFNTKCDNVDNNMAECFNAWILAARHKTIITMLEEIRVKMMKRIGQMREFCNSWISDISPMAMKVLQENTAKSMKCSIEWNSDTGYEVLHGAYKHVVDIHRQTCSCRAWMLKGIPCPHATAALHHKKLDPVDYISHWYNRETYMKTYSHFIQPVQNMKMWPECQNISVMPPPVRKLPGRPTKARRKEEGETKKTGKLSKRGLEMSCSNCHTKGHNKRKCPLGAPASGTGASFAGPSSTAAPDGSSSTATPAGSSPLGAPATTGSSTIHAAPARSSSTTGRGRGRPKGSTEKGSAATRSRMVGMGLLHTQSGATIINPGMPSERFRNVKSSAFVTGDLGYKPTSGVKWKGKQAMTSTQFQRMRGKKQVETSAKAAHLSQESSNAQSHNI